MKLVARVAALWVVWLAACSGRDRAPSHPAGAVSSPTAEVAIAAAVPAPHGGRIDLVAITDRGDAALTSDSFSELRLWPTLDGTHEPVVVHGPRATQLALGRDGDQLCGAILDEAGGVELLRFDASGGLLGRTQLPAQSPIEQVVAIPGGVLVRRADHRIERFDVRGVAAGRLVPEAGQRVVSLAARRGRAVAGITGGSDVRATTARWVGLGNRLAWGAAIELPAPLADLALAPGGRRLAGVAVDPTAEAEVVGEVVELAPRPLVVAWISVDARRAGRQLRGRRAPSEPPIIGFTDDDTVVIGVGGQLRWESAHAATPWGNETYRTYATDGQFAVGDRVAAGRSAALQVSDLAAVHYLGYRFFGDGLPATSHRFRDGGGVLLEVDGGILWLDRDLRTLPVTLDSDLHDVALALDDHHLLFTPLIYDRQRPMQHRILIRDTAAHTDTEIAVLGEVSAARYDAGTRVLAIAAGDDIMRYRLAFAPVVATPLRTLAHAGALQPFWLTDPALASGVVAVVEAPSFAGARIYRIDGDDRGPPVTPGSRALAGSIAAVDRAGAIYVAGKAVAVYRDARTAQPQVLAGVPRITALSHDGTRFAAGHGNEVAVFDARGLERWRRPVWKAGPVAWSLDDRTLFVAADGGAAVSFDAATGERLAIRCGWGFGLYDREVTASLNTPSACAAE